MLAGGVFVSLCFSHHKHRSVHLHYIYTPGFYVVRLRVNAWLKPKCVNMDKEFVSVWVSPTDYVFKQPIHQYYTSGPDGGTMWPRSSMAH